MTAFLAGLGMGLILGVLLAPAAGPLRLAQGRRSSITPTHEEIALLARRELTLRRRRHRAPTLPRAS